MALGTAAPRRPRAAGARAVPSPRRAASVVLKGLAAGLLVAAVIIAWHAATDEQEGSLAGLSSAPARQLQAETESAASAWSDDIPHTKNLFIASCVLFGCCCCCVCGGFLLDDEGVLAVMAGCCCCLAMIGCLVTWGVLMAPAWNGELAATTPVPSTIAATTAAATTAAPLPAPTTPAPAPADTTSVEQEVPHVNGLLISWITMLCLCCCSLCAAVVLSDSEEASVLASFCGCCCCMAFIACLVSWITLMMPVWSEQGDTTTTAVTTTVGAQLTTTAAATTTSGNVTVTVGRCGDPNLDNPFMPLFFDMGCLETLTVDVIPCPLEAASGFLNQLVGAVRFESQFFSLTAVMVLIVLMQLGGIPSPKGKIGICLWSLWMILQFAQFLVVVLSFWMIIVAYINASIHFGDCLVLWKNWVPLLHIVALPTYMFQPAVVPLVVVQLFYVEAINCGIKVYLREVRGSESMESDCKNIIGAMVIVLMIVIPYVFCTLCWILSASFIFSTVFFAPLAIIVGIESAILVLLMYGGMKCGTYMLSMVKLKLIEKGRKALEAAMWWVNFDEDDATAFQLIVILTVFLMCVSPFVTFGTWTAAYIYNGGSSAEHMRIIRVSYEYTFEAFTKMNIFWPTLMVDFSLLNQAFSALKDLLSVMKFDAQHFLQSSKALGTLNFILSVLKPFITYGVNALAMVGVLMGEGVRNRLNIKENIPFSEVASNYNVKLRTQTADAGQNAPEGANV